MALHKAREHLDLAKEAAAKLKLENGYKEYEQAWSQFLAQASRFYSKMEQGSKGCGKSEAWFGRKKHERKTDELLSYIHHARNTDEHGIEVVTELKTAGVKVPFTKGKPSKFSAWVKFNTDGSLSVRDSKFEEGERTVTNLEFENPKVELVTVRDSRFKDSFDPPASHLGEPLPDKSPPTVAALAIAYLEAFLAEASELPQRYPADIQR